MTEPMTLDPTNPFEAALIDMVATSRRKRNEKRGGQHGRAV